MSVQKSASSLPIFAGLVAALALAAGCSGQTHGSAGVLGELPDAPAGGAPPGASALSMMRAPAAAPKTISVTIQTLLPPGKAPHVVALGLELDGNRKSFLPVNIGSKAPCTFKSAANITCRVTFTTIAGIHWLTVDGYKSPLKGSKPPSQKPISSNGIPVDATKATTSVALAMYSQTAGISVSGLSAGITGSAAVGFAIDRSTGADPATFAVFAHDATGKIVVGPSTATFTIKSSDTDFVLTTPEPDQFVLDATAIPMAATTKIGVVSATKCAKCKLSFNVSVTDAATPTPSSSPSSSPSPSTSPSELPSTSPSPSPSVSPSIAPSGPPTAPPPTPTPAASPLVFVSYSTSSGGAIRAFSLQGVLSTSWTTSASASTLAFDSSNGFLYAVTNGAASSITAYDHSGNVQTLSPGFGSLGTVTSIVYDSHNNELYVAAGSTIKAYDAQGNLELGTGFSGFTSTTSGGLTFDANNSSLYVIDGTSVEQWSEAGVKGSASGFAAPSGCSGGGCVPTALVFNPPGEAWLYGVWSNGSATAMACWVGSGGGCHFAASSPFSTINQAAQITYDPATANVYVASGNGVSAWTFEGTSITTSGTFPSGSATAINGIALGH
jgi:hypothetical protein